MAVPGVPVGAATQAASAMAAPVVSAIADIGKAMAKVADAAKAALPFLGALGDKFKELGERFKDTFRQYIGEPLLNAIKSIGRGIVWALPTDVLDRLKDAGGKAFEAVGAVGKALGSMAIAAPVAGAAIAGLGLALSAVVSKANPAIVEQFSLALNDTIAVIGQALAPVLQVVTQLMRMFGDTLASSLGQVAEPLTEIVASLMPLFETLMEGFAVSMKIIGEVLKFVAPVIKFIADGIKTILDWWIKAVKWLLGLIGVEIGDSEVKKGSSVGAAVKQASIGSVEDVVKKAQISAMQLGNAAGVNWAEVAANRQAQANTFLENILNTLRNPLRVINTVADNIAETEKIHKELPAIHAHNQAMEEELQKLKAQRALLALGTGMAGFDVYKTRPANELPKTIPHARKGDGGGTVTADVP